MSTLYDILFGKRVPDDQDTSGEQLDPRVDGSLWELVKDHLKAGDVGSNGESNSPWSEQLDPRVDGSLWELVKDHLKAGNIGWGGEFIPPSSGPGLPEYHGDTAANPYARNSFPVSRTGFGRDFRAATAAGGDQASPMSDDSLEQLVPEWLKTGNVGWGVDTIPPLFTTENPLAPGLTQDSPGLGCDMAAKQVDAGAGRQTDKAEVGGNIQDLKGDSSNIQDTKGDTDPWNMKPSPQLVDFITHGEGLGEKPYKVEGKGNWTIGHGHEIQPGEDYSGGITPEGADKLLMKDLDERYAPAVRKWAKDNNIHLSQQQFDALVSLHYNLGLDQADTLTGLIKSGNATPDDIRSAFLLNYKGNGIPYGGLWRRRADEANMYLNGDYSRNDNRPLPEGIDWH